MLSIALAIKFDELKAGITTLIIKKHSVNGKQAWFEPREENGPAVLTALNPLTGRGVWLPLFGDMIVSDLLLGNVGFVPWL
jgi:hypothetical protein